MPTSLGKKENEPPTGEGDSEPELDPTDPLLLLAPAPAEPTTIDIPNLPPIRLTDLPAPPLRARSDPPGHAECSASIGALRMLLPRDAVDKLGVDWAGAHAVRASGDLAGYWRGNCALYLELAERQDPAKLTPDEKRTYERLTQIAAATTLAKSLDGFAASRASASGAFPDLDSMRKALDSLTGEAKALLDQLEPVVDSNGEPGPKLAPVDNAAGAARMLLLGIVKEITRQTDEILKGELPKIGSPCEAVICVLNQLTSQGNLVAHLNNSGTWQLMGKSVRKVLDDGYAKFGKIVPDSPPVSTGLLDRLFSDLDAASREHTTCAKTAEAKAADVAAAVDDPAARTQASADLGDARHALAQAANELTQSYSRMAQHVGRLADQLAERRKQLEEGKAPRGWDLDTVGRSADYIAASIEILRVTLAADPIARDPDFRGTVESIVKALDAMPVMSRLGWAARKNIDDLGAYWSKSTKAEFDALKASEVELGDLSDQMKSELPPLLHAWRKQLKLVPQNERAASKQLVFDINVVLQKHRFAVWSQLEGRKRDGLTFTIDTVGTAIILKLRDLDQAGGLFD